MILRKLLRSRALSLFIGAAAGVILCGIVFIQLRANAEPGKLVAGNLPVDLQTSSSPPHMKGAPSNHRFEVSNVGGSTVRITSVESSCGCTEAKAQPTELAPGRKGFVQLRVTPPAVGERLVSVTVRSDSPITPVLEFHFRVPSSRQPPYLLEVAGQFAYNPDDDLSEERELRVVTVESAGDDARRLVPRPTSDLG